jgi:hypothetical protein
VDTSDKTLIEKLGEQSYITLKQQSLEKIAISGAISQKSFVSSRSSHEVTAFSKLEKRFLPGGLASDLHILGGERFRISKRLYRGDGIWSGGGVGCDTILTKTIGSAATTPFPSCSVIDWLGLIFCTISLGPPGQVISKLSVIPS